MSDFHKCSQCGRWGFGTCRCAPFETRLEGDDEVTTVWSTDPEAAAERAIAIDDADDWTYNVAAKGENRHVFVEYEGAQLVFDVGGQMEPVYHAYAVKDYEPDEVSAYGEWEKRLRDKAKSQKDGAA